MFESYLEIGRGIELCPMPLECDVCWTEQANLRSTRTITLITAAVTCTQCPMLSSGGKNLYSRT